MLFTIHTRLSSPLPPLPPSKSQACALDPMLDDSVMFAKRLKSLEQPVTLCVVDDLPHGFLSLSQLSRETREAANICVERIGAVFAQKDTPPEPRKHRKLERTDRGVPGAPGETSHLIARPVGVATLAPAENGAGLTDGEDLVAAVAQNKSEADAVGL